MVSKAAGKGATVYVVDGVPVAWIRELPNGQVVGGGKAKALGAALDMLLKAKGEA